MEKIIEGIKIPHKKHNFYIFILYFILYELLCGECVVKRKMKCFSCEMERPCETCLDQISRKETSSTDINMLKGKPANE